MAPPGYSDPHEPGEPRDEPDRYGEDAPGASDPIEVLFNSPSARYRDRTPGGIASVTRRYDPPAVRLNPVPPPDPGEVAAQAAVAPLVTQLSALRAYLGPGGVALTGAGNPKLVDAKVFLDIFDTMDVWSVTGRGEVRTVRTAAQLQQVMFLLDVAVAAGALTNDDRRLAPAPGWDDLAPLQQCRVLFDTVMAMGPTGRRWRNEPSPASGRRDVDELLHSGIVHLAVPPFLSGEVPYGEIEEMALEAIGDVLAELRPDLDDDTVQRLVEDHLLYHLDTFERCGVVERRDTHTVPRRLTQTPVRAGGSVVMGDLGRELVAPLLEAAGYEVVMPADPASGTALDAAYTLTGAPESDPGQVWADWLPDADPADKVDQLIDALAVADSAPLRLALASLLSEAPVDERRRVEAIVDSPVGAYALMAIDPALAGLSPVFLREDEKEVPDGDRSWTDPTSTTLSDGRSVAEALADLGPEFSLLPLVDLLWVEMELDPGEFIGSVGAMNDIGDGDLLFLALDELWLVDVPETAELLEFLELAHPDADISVASREALERHLRHFRRR